MPKIPKAWSPHCCISHLRLPELLMCLRLFYCKWRIALNPNKTNCTMEEAPNSVAIRLKEKDECIVCCSITAYKASISSDYYLYWCVTKITMLSSHLYAVCAENSWCTKRFSLMHFWTPFPRLLRHIFQQELALWRNSFFLSCWVFSIQVFWSLHQNVSVLCVSSSLFMMLLKRQAAWVLRSWAS